MFKFIILFLFVFLVSVANAQNSSKKKIYSSFTIINDGLESTRMQLSKQTNKLYYDLIKKQSRDSVIVQLSDSLRLKTSELVNYVNRVKILLIIKTEGLEKEAIVENDTIISLKHLEHFDDYYTPSEVLIGKDNEKKLKGKLSAYDLKKEIEAYSKFISKNCFHFKQAPSFIDIANESYYYNWERQYFEEKPLAGIITYLSKLQLDILLTEQATVIHLTSIEND